MSFLMCSLESCDQRVLCEMLAALRNLFQRRLGISGNGE